MRAGYIAGHFVLASAAVLVAARADIDFSRYQVILDRKPFGDLPAPVTTDPNAPPPVSFAQGLRLSMIIEEDDGSMRIGFVDTRSNKNYTLGVGESQDGIEVVSADWDNEEAILRQGAEMALIKLQSGEVQAITSSDAQSRLQQATQTTRPSYAERRRLRQQQMQQEAAALNAQPKYTGDELAKHLYEYQMEVIRQGLPPLPIPLTPEQDSQLVKEGVLPPMDGQPVQQPTQ